jgi:menaquinone-specific isochorismate synthase
VTDLPNGLTARTTRLDDDVDLLSVAGRDGFVWERGRAGLAGRGVALRIPVDPDEPAAAAAELAAISAADEVGAPGTGPVAFAALPFDRSAPAALLVPEIVVGRAGDGTRWITQIGPSDRAPRTNTQTVLDAQEAPLDPPHAFQIEPARDVGWWCDLIDRATKAMADGSLVKVVLAREILVVASSAIDVVAVARRLRATYPDCHLFSVDGVVGASPELLVSRHGDVVRAHPMAGTAPRGGDPATDQRLAASLLASRKDREEHQITIDMVHDTLLPWCSYLDYEAEPSIVAVANVQHLATIVEGRLSQPAPSVLELVAALHPTPAVGGWPRDDALRFIAAHEALDRRRYAGAVGWVDARGNGAFAVAVRSAEIDHDTARVYAGVGVVPDSDPHAELAEAQAKAQALLGAILRV